MTLLSSPTVGGFETFWPVIIILVAAGLVVSIDLAFRDKEAARGPTFVAAVVGVILAAASIGWEVSDVPSREALGGGLVVDSFGLCLSGLILAATALCCFTSFRQVQRMGVSLGDYLALVLVSASGMLLLVHSNDLIMVFLSVELMSLGIYVLAGVNQRSSRSAESAMKYFVMGAFASGFLLFGMALLYGVTGEVKLPELSQALASGTLDSGSFQLAMLAIALVLIGFLFKIGAVPFHQWVPDVYTGAPTPVTGLMSVAVKAAAFGAFGRFLLSSTGGTSAISAEIVQQVLWVVAAVTIVLGNWLAVAQASSSIKRMLAYSGIAHSGYLLMGLMLAVTNPEALGFVLFYLVAYTFGTAGAFAVVAFCGGNKELDDSRDFRGLAWRRPGAAIAMSIFMLSSAGIPITGGFLGKYWLFAGVIEAGYVWLAIIGIVGSVIGAYYYLYVIVAMYMKEAESSEEPAGESFGVSFAIKTCALVSLLLGVLPGFVLTPAERAADDLKASRALGAPHIAGELRGPQLDVGGSPSVVEGAR